MRAGWAAALMMVFAVSCGDPSSGTSERGETDSEAEPRMESFAFELTRETVDGTDTIVETAEGVFDPGAGRASVTLRSRVSEDRMILVDGVSYFSTPDIDLGDSGFLDEPVALPPGSCYSLPWRSMGAAPEASGVLVDINNPTGLDIARLQQMVDTNAAELQPAPEESAEGDGAAYSVTLSDADQDNYRKLQNMVVRVDAAGRVVSVDWTVSMSDDDLYDGTGIDAPGDTSWTETMSLTLTDFGIPVEVTAPAPEDTCSLEQSAVEHTCGFGAADIREAAMGEIYDGDRDGLREIVESFTAETNGSCPESLSVPLLVSSAACNPDMVRFLFEDLGLDPNQTDFSGDGHTALFSITYYDAEDDPEFSQVCTPDQDLETVRVLLDAGADPCIGPDEGYEYGPPSNAPAWDPPAIGISEWDEAPEIVELVEAAATTCSP